MDNKYITSILTDENISTIEIRFNGYYQIVKEENDKNRCGFPFTAVFICFALLQKQRVLKWMQEKKLKKCIPLAGHNEQLTIINSRRKNEIRNI